MNLSPLRLGAVFCGWGILVAIFAIFGASWFRERFGTPKNGYGSVHPDGHPLSAIIGIWPDNKACP